MKLYQSFIGNSRRSHIDDVCIPFDASQNTGSEAREYELFREIHEGAGGDEPWGLLSWKFELKTCVPVPVFKTFCENELNADYDCVFINPMIANEAIHHNVWEQGELCGHKGMEQIARHLHLHTDIDTMECMGTESFSFCNFFAGTPTFWDAYLTFIDVALTELNAQAKAGTGIGKIYAGSGNYERDSSASMRIFVIERLFSSFVKTRPDIRCIPFQYSRNIYIEKFGERLGILLYQLSMVKNRAMITDDSELMKLWDETRFSIINSPYVVTIWHMDDPHEGYLGEQYEKLVEYLSLHKLNES